MIAAGGKAYLIAGGNAYQWSPRGYQQAVRLPFVEGLLTPPSTLRALNAGYSPVLHQSIEAESRNAA